MLPIFSPPAKRTVSDCVRAKDKPEIFKSVEANKFSSHLKKYDHDRLKHIIKMKEASSNDLKSLPERLRSSEEKNAQLEQ